MKKAMLLLVLFGLSGCAGRVLTANERSVTVQAGSVMADEAQRLADAECKKHGRIARLSLRPVPNQYVFDCVQ